MLPGDPCGSGAVEGGALAGDLTVAAATSATRGGRPGPAPTSRSARPRSRRARPVRTGPVRLLHDAWPSRERPEPVGTPGAPTTPPTRGPGRRRRRTTPSEPAAGRGQHDADDGTTSHDRVARRGDGDRRHESRAGPRPAGSAARRMPGRAPPHLVASPDRRLNHAQLRARRPALVPHADPQPRTVPRRHPAGRARRRGAVAPQRRRRQGQRLRRPGPRRVRRPGLLAVGVPFSSDAAVVPIGIAISVVLWLIVGPSPPGGHPQPDGLVVRLLAQLLVARRSASGSAPWRAGDRPLQPRRSAGLTRPRSHRHQVADRLQLRRADAADGLEVVDEANGPLASRWSTIAGGRRADAGQRVELLGRGPVDVDGPGGAAASRGRGGGGRRTARRPRGRRSVRRRRAGRPGSSGPDRRGESRRRRRWRAVHRGVPATLYTPGRRRRRRRGRRTSPVPSTSGTPRDGGGAVASPATVDAATAARPRSAATGAQQPPAGDDGEHATGASVRRGRRRTSRSTGAGAPSARCRRRVGTAGGSSRMVEGHGILLGGERAAEDVGVG